MDEIKPLTYQELQNKSEFEFVSKTPDWEVYRITDSVGMFIIFDLTTGDSITLDFDDIPQVFDLITQINKINEAELDRVPIEELE